MGVGIDNKAPDAKQVVFALTRPSRCHACDQRLPPGEIVKLEEKRDEREALCCKCAGLSSLELVGKGNAKITRLASKYSSTKYIVMQWSELWKCYERIGMLAESQAIDQAEKESGCALPNRKNRQ